MLGNYTIWVMVWDWFDPSVGQLNFNSFLFTT